MAEQDIQFPAEELQDVQAQDQPPAGPAAEIAEQQPPVVPRQPQEGQEVGDQAQQLEVLFAIYIVFFAVVYLSFLLCREYFCKMILRRDGSKSDYSYIVNSQLRARFRQNISAR